MHDYVEELMELVIDLELDACEGVYSDFQDDDYEIEEAAVM